LISGVVAIIGVMAVILVVMLRRGRLQPVQTALSAASVRYRKSTYAKRATDRNRRV